MFAYCLNNPVTGYDPTGMVNAEGLAVGLALIGLGALLIAATVLTAGAASPLVATLGTAACSAVGYAALQTGTVVATAAYEETPIVIDVTATNGLIWENIGLYLSHLRTTKNRGVFFRLMTVAHN